MLYSNFMVISFPFVTLVERTEKVQKQNVSGEVNKEIMKSPPTNSPPPKKLELNNERDMICLSNLEEVVFYNSPYKCPFNETNKKKKTPVDYDKYLEFFE